MAIVQKSQCSAVQCAHPGEKSHLLAIMHSSTAPPSSIVRLTGQLSGIPLMCRLDQRRRSGYVDMWICGSMSGAEISQGGLVRTQTNTSWDGRGIVKSELHGPGILASGHLVCPRPSGYNLGPQSHIQKSSPTTIEALTDGARPRDQILMLVTEGGVEYEPYALKWCGGRQDREQLRMRRVMDGGEDIRWTVPRDLLLTNGQWEWGIGL
ncbi:hypothetical protein EGW08_017948 [Elysia chlorotica]|uniref:Uncharacterized protein n=1 Tax=Elysia chlorotica TaxID=188477 RepID=A0A3S1H8I9_ELYCH|nr:hypothetical protein EGW08_017948 [Elysia chlorotica]